MCCDKAVEVMRVQTGSWSLTRGFRECFLEELILNFCSYFYRGPASPKLIVEPRGQGPLHISLCPTRLLSVPPSYVLLPSPCQEWVPKLNKQRGQCRVGGVCRPHCWWECAVSVAGCYHWAFYLLLHGVWRL